MWLVRPPGQRGMTAACSHVTRADPCTREPGAPMGRESALQAKWASRARAALPALPAGGAYRPRWRRPAGRGSLLPDGPRGTPLPCAAPAPVRPAGRLPPCARPRKPASAAWGEGSAGLPGARRPRVGSLRRLRPVWPPRQGRGPGAALSSAPLPVACSALRSSRRAFVSEELRLHLCPRLAVTVCSGAPAREQFGGGGSVFESGAER